jgi:hypothetical protein
MGIPTRHAVHQIQYHWDPLQSTNPDQQVNRRRKTAAFDTADAGDDPGTVTRQEKLPNEVSYCLRFRRTANRVLAHLGRAGGL